MTVQLTINENQGRHGEILLKEVIVGPQYFELINMLYCKNDTITIYLDNNGGYLHGHNNL